MYYEAEGDQDQQAQQQAPSDQQQAQDPNAQQAQQSAPSDQQQAQDLKAQQPDPKLDPMKKFLLLSKLVELKHYLELYAVSSESSKDTKNLIKFIGVVIDFYDIFDYNSLRILSENIMSESAKLIKQKDKKGA